MARLDAAAPTAPATALPIVGKAGPFRAACFQSSFGGVSSYFRYSW